MKLKKHKKLTKALVKNARYRIKTALVKRAKVKDHRPTVAQCQSWFAILNKGIFENSLTIPPFEIKRLKDCWGQCCMSWDARTIKINDKYIPTADHPSIAYCIEMNYKFDTWKDFVEVLAHEMIHLWQMTVYKDKTANHNKSFFLWRNKFKQFSLGLTGW